MAIAADELAAHHQQGRVPFLSGRSLACSTNPCPACGWASSRRARWKSSGEITASTTRLATLTAWRGVQRGRAAGRPAALRLRRGAHRCEGLAHPARRLRNASARRSPRCSIGWSATSPRRLSERLRAANERLVSGRLPGRRHLAQGARFARRARGAGQRLLRRADAARHGEFPHLRHPAAPLRALRPRARLREEGRRAGQQRTRRARCREGRRHRRRPATRSSPASCTTSSSST